MNSIRRYADPEALSRAAADLFCSTVRQAASEGRPAHLAVSGGSTPRRMFEMLSEGELRASTPWDWLQLCWVDERFVPPEDPASNYRMVRETLLEHVPLPATNIHRIPAELGTPEQVADVYQLELQAILPRVANGFPRFDLVFLGMGSDGHTGSLFPRSPALYEARRWVVANPVPSLPHPRITLTFPAIDHAAVIAFLVAGQDKAAMLKEVLTAPKDVILRPAQGVQPAAGKLLWMADAAALAELPPTP